MKYNNYIKINIFCSKKIQCNFQWNMKFKIIKYEKNMLNYETIINLYTENLLILETWI